MPPQPSPLPESTDAALDSFINRARIEHQKAAPVFQHPSLEPDARARHTLLYGIGFGFLASLIFAIVSQGINTLMLLDVRMAPNFIHWLLVFLRIVVIGTVFCLISVSPFKLQNWIALALLVLVLYLIFDFNYQELGNLIAAVMESIAFLFWFLIPILFILMTPIPFHLLFRWVVKMQVRHHYRMIFAPQRMVPVLVLFTITALIGSLFVFSSPERKAICAMDALMAEASAARTEEELPYAVRYAVGTPFFQYARGSYYLTSAHNPLPKRVYADGRPYLMDTSVTAEFASGYWLTCDFGHTTGRVIKCRSDYLPLYPGING